MSRPCNKTEFPKNDLKLGIKSSLPNVRSTLALLCLIYRCTNDGDKIKYSQSAGASIVLETGLEKRMIAKYSSLYLAAGDKDTLFVDNINKNQLFKSQLESLIVAFELVWRLAKIEYEDKTKSNTAERTGGTRYPKELFFSANMDVISNLIDENESGYTETLLNWIGMSTASHSQCEERLIRLFTYFSETAIYKLNDGTQDIIFDLNGVYKELNINPYVDIDDAAEAKGPLRVLKSALSDHLNSYLDYSGGKVSVKSGKGTDLAKYQSRVDVYQTISSVAFPVPVVPTSVTFNERTGISNSLPRNRIYFGAPGTGKSYRLNETVAGMISSDEDYERVTFHPDYTYAQFVGTYRPASLDDGTISYRFVPGPFMRLYVKAVKNIIDATDASGTIDVKKINPFVLIIEEMNRANAAAVFGDLFQLLDRDKDNVSEYAVQTSEEIRDYLVKELGGNSNDFTSIKLPDNMFIWATMNSADQGVSPMDTAFKRRWSFEYIGINDGEKDSTGKTNVPGEFKLPNGSKIKWNAFRKALNDLLSSNNVKINEDKLMGPFFINTSKYIKLGTTDELEDDFYELVENKVLMYLFEDAAKTKRSKVFNGSVDSNRFSSLKKAFEDRSISIFQNIDGDTFEDRYKSYC